MVRDAVSNPHVNPTIDNKTIPVLNNLFFLNVIMAQNIKLTTNVKFAPWFVGATS